MSTTIIRKPSFAGLSLLIESRRLLHSSFPHGAQDLGITFYIQGCGLVVAKFPLAESFCSIPSKMDPNFVQPRDSICTGICTERLLWRKQWMNIVVCGFILVCMAAIVCCRPSSAVTKDWRKYVFLQVANWLWMETSDFELWVKSHLHKSPTLIVYTGCKRSCSSRNGVATGSVSNSASLLIYATSFPVAGEVSGRSFFRNRQ